MHRKQILRVIGLISQAANLILLCKENLGSTTASEDQYCTFRKPPMFDSNLVRSLMISFTPLALSKDYLDLDSMRF